MAGKSELERLERLEADYAFTREAFTEIRDHLARQNGHIDHLRIFRTQVKAVLATLGAITSLALACAGIAVAVAVGFL